METHLSEEKSRVGGSALFPSAGAIKQDIEDKKASQDGSNNLETLRLTLPESAMNAILAVQDEQPQVSEGVTYSPVHNTGDQPDSPSPQEHSSEYSSDEDAELSQGEKKYSVKRKKKRRKHKHKHKKLKRHHRSDSPHSVADMEHIKIPVGAVFLDDIPGLQPKHAYHVDRKKNKDLWHYQSISSRHIAKYKSFSRSCLGASNLMLNKQASTKTKKGFDFARYFGKVGMRQIRCKGTGIEIQAKAQMSDKSFIPVPKRDTQSSSPPETSSLSYSCFDKATSLYVHGKGLDYKCNTGDMVTTAVEEKDFIMDEIIEKVGYFNERTRKDPGNVTLWLEFVAFQDIISQREKIGAADLSQTVSLSEQYRPTKSVIEKKLAILEKALESNPSSMELKLAQLELYQDIWESVKLEKAWEELLFVHSGNVDLWQEYLAKQQCSSMQGFTVNKGVKRYQKCFKTLTAIMEGQVKVIQKDSDMEEKMIGLFSQYCNFLHFTGYTERAFATFQAMIEFNLYCPPSLNLTSTMDRAAKLQEFWDSSVPRFGEEAAQGWAKWVEQKGKNIEQPVSFIDVNLDEQEDAIINEQLSRSVSWVKMEKLRENFHFLPWKPDPSKNETEESVEDPERLVLFEDVAPILFKVSKSESCVRIVCLFLKFLGLPSAILNEKIQFWSQDTNSLKFEQYSEKSVSQFAQLAECDVAKCLDIKLSLNQGLLTFVQNILKQAESYFSLTNRNFFTLLRLELEVLKHEARTISEIPIAGIKEIKKFGKNLLKENHNRNNLLLWNAYIRLLWACSDKIGETVSMVETALAMFMGSHNSSEAGRRYGLCCLCLTYCQILLNFEPLEHIESSLRCSSPTSNDKQQAIKCLGALMENKVFKPGSSTEVSPPYILKVRSLFNKSISEYASKCNFTHTDNCKILSTLTDCFALFEFCASNFKIANKVYESVRLNVQKLSLGEPDFNGVCSTIQNNLFLSQISFITNVMHISIIPLATVRKVISTGLNEFPECSKLHAAFLKLEERSHITGRLRKFYTGALRKATSLTTPVFAVCSELLRHEKITTFASGAQSVTVGSSSECTDTGIVHRLRALFENVLGLPVSSHSPLIWRLYLSFEFKHGSMSKAKGILYRALQSCPWAKCIFMDGISLFGDVDLQEMMDLMTEEEIRVRIPLEEVDLLRTAEKGDSELEVKEEPDADEEHENQHYA